MNNNLKILIEYIYTYQCTLTTQKGLVIIH